MAPATAATIRGITEAAVRSSINTSTVNSTPAIGALKMPAMPAAAPQPTSTISVFGDNRNMLPRFEPIAAPVYTIGPSAPTDPPNPIVMELATTEVYILWNFRRLFFCDME